VFRATEPVDFFDEVEDLHGAAARLVGSSSNDAER
jgi:hypothetical protein